MTQILNIGILGANDKAEWDGLEPFDQLRGWQGTQTCNEVDRSAERQDKIDIAHGKRLSGYRQD